MLKSKKGFTLVELMIVVVMVGILVIVTLINFNDFNENTTTPNEAKQVEQTIELDDEDKTLWNFYSPETYTYLDMDKIK